MRDGVERLTSGHLWHDGGNAGQITNWVNLSPGIHPKRLRAEIDNSMIALADAMNKHVARVERDFRTLLERKLGKTKSRRAFRKHIVKIRMLAAAKMKAFVDRKLP